MTPSQLAQLAEALVPFVDLHRARDERYRARGGKPEKFHDTHPAYDITADQLRLGAWRKLESAQALVREAQAAKPYAYEFARDNGDGTYSVVIERGSLARVGVNAWGYGPPQVPHPDHPVKPLYEHPAAPQTEAQAAEAKKLSDLRDVHEAQGRDGTWNYDPYMQGMFNGLELALAIAEGREPAYRAMPPTGWLVDRRMSAPDAAPTAEARKPFVLNPPPDL